MYAANCCIYPNSELLVIITAINVIETENRTIVWRFLEYLHFLIDFLCYKITGKVKNISMGIYQIKLQHILDLLKVKYRINKKDIYPIGFNRNTFLKIFFLCNDIHVVENFLVSKFKNYKWGDLTTNEIMNIALLYSGNKKLEGCMNYYTVLKWIYFHNR